MKRLTKLQLSNRAHNRLCKKHKRIAENSKGRNYDIAFVKMNYHSSVAFKQQKLGRVLSQSEKKKAYDDIILTFY